MPKRRQPKSSEINKEIEAFAAGADNTEEQKLDPNAKRDYKSLGIHFNEFEWTALEKASEKSGRSKLNFLRHSMLTLAKETLN